MLRSAASPGSVGFGRFGSGTSGLLMKPLPAGHLFGLSADEKCARPETKRAPPISDLSEIGGALLPQRNRRVYLILASRNSTCFLATGSYFFLVSFSVIVREFFLVT